MKVHVHNIKWYTDKGKPATATYCKNAGLPKECDIEVADTDDIAEELYEQYNADIFTYEYDLCKSVEEQVQAVLRRCIKGYDEYDSDFSAQDAVDEIATIVGL